MGDLPHPRQREIVLRVAVKRRAAFLWAQHVFEAKDSGLSDEEMSRIAFGPDAPYFEPLEARWFVPSTS